MLKILPSIHKNKFIFTFFLYSSFVVADSYVTNSYNNQGTVGLINAPTARFFDEGVHGLTIYDGNPDQKMTITANPFNWLEAKRYVCP